MSDLAHSAHLEAQRSRLLTSRDRLSALESLSWRGLGPLSPESNAIHAQIAQLRPWLANEVTLHGRLTPAVVETPALLLHRPTTEEPWRWQVQPYLMAWPCLPPKVGNVSVLQRPYLTAKPGDFLYLHAVWAISPPPLDGYGRLGCTRAELLVTQQADLEGQNDVSPITLQTTRRWHHLLGSISAAGQFVGVGFTSPFVPPQL